MATLLACAGWVMIRTAAVNSAKSFPDSGRSTRQRGVELEGLGKDSFWHNYYPTCLIMTSRLAASEAMAAGKTDDGIFDGIWKK